MANEIDWLIAYAASLEQDAARYRLLRHLVGAAKDRQGQHFTFNYLAPAPGANLYRGSVAQHLDAALDVILAKHREADEWERQVREQEDGLSQQKKERNDGR